MSKTTATLKTLALSIPVHQWTHTGQRVLLVKCTAAGGKSYNGFVYPKEVGAKIKPQYCSLKTDCESGGFFGWSWGIGFGDGKEPDYSGDWFVLAAPPEQVLEAEGGPKCKIAAETPDEVDCEIVYVGDALGAVMFVHEGRMAWAKHQRDYALARGNEAAAKANSGYSGVGANSGDRGVGANSGYSGVARVTGNHCVAASTGEDSTLDVSPASLGAIFARNWYWQQHVGAVVVCRWLDDAKQLQHRLFVADSEDLVRVVDGQMRKE